MDDVEQQVTLLKTIADATRLRILRLLAQRPHTGTELVAELGLTPPTISHHLHRLREVGIVQSRAEAQRRIWSLEPTVLGAATPRPSREGRGDDDATRKAASFFDGERLRSLPPPGTARTAVLRELARRFEPGTSYQEREVNAILGSAFADAATLRRELVAHHYLTRAGFVYQVADVAPAETDGAEPPQAETDWLAGIIRGALTP